MYVCVYVRMNINAEYITIMLSQALNHSKLAVDYSSDQLSKAEALHVNGGILKDLGHLEQAEKVIVNIYIILCLYSRFNIGRLK